MTLSDKQDDAGHFLHDTEVLRTKDVKEFIKKIEIRMLKKFKMASISIMKIIKEEAGNGLL